MLSSVSWSEKRQAGHNVIREEKISRLYPSEVPYFQSADFQGHLRSGSRSQGHEVLLALTVNASVTGWRGMHSARFSMPSKRKSAITY